VSNELNQQQVPESLYGVGIAKLHHRTVTDNRDFGEINVGDEVKVHRHWGRYRIEAPNGWTTLTMYENAMRDSVEFTSIVGKTTLVKHGMYQFDESDDESY